MSNENKIEDVVEKPILEEIPTKSGEIIDPDNFDHLIPQMNVNVPAVNEQPVESLIENEALLGIYGEILGTAAGRTQADHRIHR
jgi:hypothetical protein